MKIITENAVYVQKNDIGYLLNSTNLPIPASIFKSFLERSIVIINDSNRYEFEKFENDSEIKFLKKLDWIVDYNEIKDLSDYEIIKMLQSIAQLKDQMLEQLISMSEDERKENFDMITKCELLDFKMHSLRDIFCFKQGDLKMTLPEGVDYPEAFIQKDEKGIQKIMRRIFPQKKKAK